MATDLLFRTQVITREQRELFSYWQSRRENPDGLPTRDAVDPLALPHLLPALSILEVNGGLDSLSYRLAGSRIRDIYGYELAGSLFFDLNLGLKRGYWMSVYQEVIGGCPMQGSVRGPLANRDHLVQFWLRLPLQGRNGQIDHILGMDAAIPASLLVSETMRGDVAPDVTSDKGRLRA